MNTEFGSGTRQEQSLITLGTRDAVFILVAALSGIMGPGAIVSYQVINSLAELKSDMQHVKLNMARLGDKVDALDARVTEVAVGLAELRGETRGRLAAKEHKDP